MLAALHEREPLAAGASVGDVRAIVLDALRSVGAPPDAGLAEAAIDAMVASGVVERSATTVRMAGHRVTLDADDAEVRRMLAAIGGDAEATPPTIAELERTGVRRDVIEAAVGAGLAVSVSKQLVFTPELVARAESIVRRSTEGITVSAFREALHTSRKFALPLLEYFDRTGISRRDGDLRFPR